MATELSSALVTDRQVFLPVGQTYDRWEIHPYLSINGLAAHVRDSREEVRMPAYPHQIAGYGNPAPLQTAKNGPDFPLVVDLIS